MKPTQEQVIAWAREAGISLTTDWMGRPMHLSIGSHGDVGLKGTQEIEMLAALAYEAGRKDENEACAKVCLEETPTLDGQLCAEAIRARVKK